MTKKLARNGVWESSSMMLPEHKEQIYEASIRPERRTKPMLDPQRWEEINERLNVACQTGEEIALRLWEPDGDWTVRGAIEKLDLPSRRIFIGGQWVKLGSIVEVVE